MAHLAEILEKEDSINFNGDYPLTIAEAREKLVELLLNKQ